MVVSVREPDERETAARMAVDARAGRVLTDAEWAKAKARLVEFVAILRSWDGEASGEDPAECRPKAA